MIKLLSNKVLIKQNQHEGAGPIVIPDAAKEKPNTGVVIAVGPGGYTKHGVKIQMNVKVGDEVLFNEFAAQEIEVGDDKYLLIGEDQIIGIVK